MARYTGSVCRLCRREGLKLFLKGERCYTDKCAIERRNYPPGQHGQGAREVLRVLRSSCARSRSCGASTACSRGSSAATSTMADRAKGVTGETLLQLLERRLDNMVYRLGFATSRSEARQLVRHGHFQVNGRKVEHSLVPGQARATSITVRERSQQGRAHPGGARAGAAPRRPGLARGRSPEAFTGRVKALPARADLTMPINEKLIVELYSK